MVSNADDEGLSWVKVCNFRLDARTFIFIGDEMVIDLGGVGPCVINSKRMGVIEILAHFCL